MVSLGCFLLLLAARHLRSFNVDTGRSWVSPPTSPHFGHQVLQHSDGRRSWVLATSLGGGRSGLLYRCDFKDEIRCEEVSLGEDIQKLRKLQPGIALARSPEQILACVQQRRRQRRKVTEELNGLCVLFAVDLGQKTFLNLTDIIEAKLNKGLQKRRKRSSTGIRSEGAKDFSSARSSEAATEAGNGTYHDPESAHRCRGECAEKAPMDGDAESGHGILNANNNNNYEEEDEDESYLRTEIAIVLDGSGSIEAEDFIRAKEFIYNVMKAFYEKCFECVFALVQYGSIIRTEFDLREGKVANGALEKVQAVKQVYNVTRTASAIQHVLDSIFNESCGSQKNAAKKIIVLTDGETFLDTLDLKTVISSERMAGIDRYAIGVGEAFNTLKAQQELSLIASDPDESHLFRVNNYSALNVLLSTLQQKIGIEGTAGDILQFELAQSGFSVHLLDQNQLLFGAVGAFDWSGGVLHYDIPSETAVFLNESAEDAGSRNGYLGYSVGAVNTGQGAMIVTGGPRHGMTGIVMVFEGGRLKQTLEGEQLGSYYGSELCPLDIDQDGSTDHLLVGAPFFHIHGEEGKVYVYRLDHETNRFALAGHLRGHPAFTSARFGFAIAGTGDVDRDGFGDLAVGAPLEGHEANPSSFGSVYIYNGNRDGIRDAFSQRITAAQIGPGLVYFGRSVAGGLDFTEDGLPDIAVGSLGSIALLRSRPVIRLVPAVQFTPGQILNFYNSSLITAQVCFSRTDSLEASQPGMQNLHIRYTLDLDVEMDKKRAQFEDHATTATREIFYQEPACSELQFQILPCVYDCFSSVVLRLGYQLLDDPVYHDLRHPLPVLDIYQGSELYVQLPYEDACKEKTACSPHLSLTLQAAKELVAGHTKDLTLTIFLGNSGDSSYMTWLVLEYPTNLLFKNVQELSSTVVDCDAPKSAATLLSSLRCKVGHPVFETTTANFSVTWQVDGKRFPGNLADVTVNVTNINRNSTALMKKHSVDVKYALTAILSRPSERVYVSVHERSPQSARFEFKINGKNQFGAELQLQIWVPVLVDAHLVARVKTALGSQSSTMCKTEKSFRHKEAKDIKGVRYQLVTCIITSERENVTVTAELSLANSQQVLQDRTHLLVIGEILFNRNLYVGLSEESHTAEITVVLLREKEFSFLPVIIGSSVGGIFLLAFIIVGLYKCGFFKRSYQNRMEEQNDS